MSSSENVESLGSTPIPSADGPIHDRLDPILEVVGNAAESRQRPHDALRAFVLRLLFTFARRQLTHPLSEFWQLLPRLQFGRIRKDHVLECVLNRAPTKF